MEPEPAFKEIDWKKQEAEDDQALRDLLNETRENEGGPDLFNPDRPFDLGEKAADAEDYEDISDDDLPEEEDAAGGDDGDVPGLTDDMGTSHENDDLFGDGDDFDTSQLFGDGDQQDGYEPHIDGGHSSQHPETDDFEQEINLRELNFPEHYDSSSQDPSIPNGPREPEEDALKRLFPSFKKGDTIDWNELLPTKKAYFVPRVPVKPPKQLALTKVGLDLAADSEKLFRTAAPSAPLDSKRREAEAEAKGLVPIIREDVVEDEAEDWFDYAPLNPDEEIGGTTLAMINVICADFESHLDREPSPVPVVKEEDVPMDDWEREFLAESGNSRKRPREETDFVNIPKYDVPDFDHFEQMAAQVANKVVLDLNDPHLLVEFNEFNPATKRRRLAPSIVKRSGGNSLASILRRRYNFSNDEAYDALKQNHESKVRATLGNLSVEHSMPAVKLQWPYYRTKLFAQDARSFHRPSLKLGRVQGGFVSFTKAATRKRKEIKKLGSIQEIFKTCKDLSLSETASTATLFEYSEEHPTVLSNFGMGNRVINYYRRKDTEDHERPMPDDKVGDLTVLLPEDKSPFSNFGMVDPGETVRTIHNAMYRAPIFKHEPQKTDFLAIRSTTGMAGATWHLRNIDNLFVVGQQFPSMEIPGPHSRKVTNATKNRMKMIAYRKIKHDPAGHLKIGDITAHISESTDMQNRQKLKEFIQYDKIGKVWQMRDGDVVPDEAKIRSMVKPEEVCVIDAMQVGSRHLEDSGLTAQDDDDEGDGKEGHDIEQDLAPWKTSKAFLEASADKAMLQLHGDGDPSGCGLAISMIKTSMKGGYMEAAGVPNPSGNSKAYNGHHYNVKQQQMIYNEAIRNIWDKQKANLSDPVEHPWNDDEEEANKNNVAPTPRSQQFDDTASQYSTTSRQGKVMLITRKMRDPDGSVREVSEIIKEPRVWREYQRRRNQLNMESKDLYSLKPTGDESIDREEMKKVKMELARLERNRERRHTREKQKGIFRASVDRDVASPSSTPAPTIEKPQGTTRKCANCGQYGHIKTNKKLCPMLNGTAKMENIDANHGGFGAITLPSFA